MQANDLTMVRGDTPSWLVTLTRDSLPIDLTGAAVTFSVKRSPADDPVLFTHNTTEGGVVVNGSPLNGECVVTLDTADTGTMKVGGEIALFYAVKVVEQDGRVSTPLTGRLYVQANAS